MVEGLSNKGENGKVNKMIVTPSIHEKKIHAYLGRTTEHIFTDTCHIYFILLTLFRKYYCIISNKKSS
jgi:hypothetical protein